MVVKSLKDTKMVRQTRIKDWERVVCEMTDKMVQDPANRLQALEDLLDMIEDMVCNAYIKGKSNAKKG
jgi:hypothetical protein